MVVLADPLPFIRQPLVGELLFDGPAPGHGVGILLAHVVRA
jgi:hypothetical protein